MATVSVSDTVAYVHFFISYKDVSGVEYFTYQVLELRVEVLNRELGEFGFSLRDQPHFYLEIMNQYQERYKFFSERFKRKL